MDDRISQDILLVALDTGEIDLFQLGAIEQIDIPAITGKQGVPITIRAYRYLVLQMSKLIQHKTTFSPEEYKFRYVVRTELICYPGQISDTLICVLCKADIILQCQFLFNFSRVEKFDNIQNLRVVLKELTGFLKFSCPEQRYCCHIGLVH